MKESAHSYMPRPLLGILVLGLAARLLFMVVGVPAYYHSTGQFVLNGDSSSYTESFENLWQSGWYTFNKLLPDASFGRLPGYPFFYGSIG